MIEPGLLMVIGLAYLLGSVPFGLLLTKWAGMGDIRDIGSGNIGATNVLRTGSRQLALATLLLDGGKGALAVWLVSVVSGDQLLAGWAGLAAMLGHCLPVWLRFSGGKGVATGLAALAAISWPAGLVMVLVWLLVAALFRISSAAALAGWLAAPLWLFWQGPDGLILPVTLMALLSWLRHHQNIRRLLAGTESRMGRRKKD
jgi:glycerol-3-phosphate acyltransferase PlsY